MDHSKTDTWTPPKQRGPPPQQRWPPTQQDSYDM